MMEALVAFVGFGLFIIHELEEIVRFVPWIRHHEHDPAFARQMIISNRTAYPSTETVAIIILEESIVALALLGGAIVLHSLTQRSIEAGRLVASRRLLYSLVMVPA